MNLDRFVALDVETANADLASICQVGVVVFSGSTIETTWTSLVNPEDEFDGINVSIHGIDEDAVRGAPRFVDIAPTLFGLLTNRIVATHMSFDRVALSRVSEKHGLSELDCQSIDTARVARRTWFQFTRSGYGLADLAKHCGIDFRQHDALEDARAAGQVLIAAMATSGLDINQWVGRAYQPVDRGEAREANPNGELVGETVVFTGALSIPRREAADMAASAGCDVAGSVGKATTLLVVGDQDVRKLLGHEKSSKHRKAEEMIAKGQVIRILTESDFRMLVALSGTKSVEAPKKSRHKVDRPVEQPRQSIPVPDEPVARNLLGIELEKKGLIDNAVECYEANARDGFDGSHPYRRLTIIYRRRGEHDRELATLRRAIEVFEGLQNSPRADVAPKLEEFRERYRVMSAKTSDESKPAQTTAKPDPRAAARSPVVTVTTRHESEADQPWRTGERVVSEFSIGGVLAGSSSIEMSAGPGFLGVSGESHYQDALKAAKQSKAEFEPTFEATLVAEPSNEFDPNAVAVIIAPFGKVGYVPEVVAERFQKIVIAARQPVHCQAKLRGGTSEKPLIGVVHRYNEIYRRAPKHVHRGQPAATRCVLDDTSCQRRTLGGGKG